LKGLQEALIDDEKKIKDKLNAIREIEVKEVLFDPYLAQIETGKKMRKSRVAAKYYKA
jgi:hypothetical protein